MTGKSGPFLAILTVLVTFFSAITPARATSDGLIAHWQFDETSGTTASDSKGGSDGTLSGGPVWQPSGGRIGGALGFDGVDDEVDTGTIPGLVADPGNAFTFAFWYKAAPGANNDLFGWSAYRFCTTGYNADLMACSIDSSSSFAVSTTNINDNNWHHIAFTATNSIQYLYVDGNAEDSTSDAINTTNPTAGIVIGARDFGGHIQAQFDDVRIYDRALSAAEVLALYNTKYCAAPVRPESVMFYNACCKTYQFCNGTDWVPIGSAPHCTSDSLISDLVAHWKLDESSGTTAADSAGSNHGTLVGSPTWTTGRIGGALDFNGVDNRVVFNQGYSSVNYFISFWINPRAVNKWTYLFDHDPNNSKAVIIGFQSGNINYYDGSYPTGNPSDTQIPITENNWQHIVMGTDGINIYGYKNGVNIVNIVGHWDSLPYVHSQFIIGSRIYNDYFFDGLLDDVRIYNRALSAAEVEQIYNGTDMCP